jgi:hypothetical protein
VQILTVILLALCAFMAGYSLARSKFSRYRATVNYVAYEYFKELEQLNVSADFVKGAESFAESIRPYV